jgi:hypothetical protein
MSFNLHAKGSMWCSACSYLISIKFARQMLQRLSIVCVQNLCYGIPLSAWLLQLELVTRRQVEHLEFRLQCVNQMLSEISGATCD